MRRVIGMTLPGYPHAGIAIAASRAGALGVLDLEYVRDIGVASRTVASLTRFSSGARGIKIDLSSKDFATTVLGGLPDEIGVVVISNPSLTDLPDQLRVIQSCGRKALVETTDADTATAAADAGADGLIVKGNEAAGRVGEETAFVLFQRCVQRIGLPLWVQGGIGPSTAAACLTGGAAGVVLDWQLALTRESPLPDAVKARLAAMDGGETMTVRSGRLGDLMRIYSQVGRQTIEAIHGKAEQLLADEVEGEPRAAWRTAIAGYLARVSPDRPLLVSQDAAFAAGLARQHHTVAGLLHAIETAWPTHVRTAQETLPLTEHSPLALSHGTRYPILQGPMTRVSDVPGFCEAVGEGALPFLALALLRAPEVEALLVETKARMGERPWGVGILGFVPLALRQEQLEVVRRYKPPFAIIAGGRSDQATHMERDGIATYLHVPSPGLLEQFLEAGARRFIFEGRECGGHVGPRSSFVLWQSMIDAITAQIESGKVEASACHLIFAGGIHDARSAAMVAVMAGPLAARGVKIGVLMGTAYLFTDEAVKSQAIVPQFQREALRCVHTVLLESGPGHAIRCIDTPYQVTFNREKERLLAAGYQPDEVRLALETLNLGRLRLASKGSERDPSNKSTPDAVSRRKASPRRQRSEGMYMIGQIASLRNRVTTVAELHSEVAVGSTDIVRAIRLGESGPTLPIRLSDVAIIGMSVLLPKAPSLVRYWANILDKVDAIEEVPKHRWDTTDYFHPDRTQRDRIYSTWGGFLDDVPFDPTQYGMPPNSISSIEPAHLLVLEAARAALADAGLLDRTFDREHTSVILGAGGGVADLGGRYGFRAALPMFFGDDAAGILDRIGDSLPEWSEDSFAGILMNVAAGRVANRFDLGGSNYTVDAACASSLAAVQLGMQELQTGRSNLALVGGIDTMQSPFAYLAFSKTQALSPRGRCRPFDESADGIVISEGVAMLVLKRLDDAERDGDRIYAVIKGIGSSSDGRAKGLTAPSPDGQMRALQRAYTEAGISPTTVGLIEAHGTGTVAGDRAEVAALTQFFAAARAERQSCALGSVKSMIGHTKCTAGVAGVVKVALALHHKALPPTLGVERPNSHANFPQTPFYVNSETRPWIGSPAGEPRRAGVSAFGFGGTNFHAVLEEYSGAFSLEEEAALRDWPNELFIWSAADRAGLLEVLAPYEQLLSAGARPRLADLAFTICSESEGQPSDSVLRLAIVAYSIDDLTRKLIAARRLLADSGHHQLNDPSGVFFSEQPLARSGRLAFLFVGQGSQYPNMGRDLALHFSEARIAYEEADACLANRLAGRLSSRIFPTPSFSEEEARLQREALVDTHIAQPALGVMEVATSRLLRALGVVPDMVAGHSYGEFVALWAADVFSDEVLFHISEARGRFMRRSSGADPGTMAAIDADAATVASALDGLEAVTCANINSPRQTVISGSRTSVEAAVQLFAARGVPARVLPVACAFHSPLVAAARDQLAAVLAETSFRRPSIPVYSNTMGAAYSDDPSKIAALLTEHLARPVEFQRQVETMYADGARIFLEVGPKGALTGLISQILAERPHVAVSTDQQARSGIHQLQLALARLAAEGVRIATQRLFAGRGVKRLDLQSLGPESLAAEHSPTMWLVNGSRAVRARDATKTVSPSRLSLADLGSSNGAVAVSGPAFGGIVGSAPVEEPSPTSVPPASMRGNPRPVGSTNHSGTSSVDPSNDHELVSGQSLAVVRQDGAAVVEQFQQMMGRFLATQQEFQQLTSRFLETQRAVMLAYLAGKPGGVDWSDQAPGLPPVGWDAPAPKPAGSTLLPPSPAFQIVEQAVPAVEQHTDRDSSGTVSITRPGTATQPSEASAVAAPPPVAATVAAPTAPAMTRELATARLLAVVADRTGYPTEMLGLVLDLEADLGIDSIKRVEILGAYRKQIGDRGELSEASMEQLVAARTLASIVDWTLEHAAGTAAPDPAIPLTAAGSQHAEAAAAPAAGEAARPEIQRSTLTVVEAPLANQPVGLAAEGVLLITDDERGVAAALAKHAREAGLKVALARAGTTNAELGSYSCSFTSPDEVQALASTIRAHQGAIAAIVHLLPLRQAPALEALDLRAWRERLAADVGGLFQLAKVCAADLHAAAQQGGAAVLAVTGMGGAFGVGGSAPPFVGNGGVAGLAKTLAQEWTDVRVRAVDLDLSERVDVLAGRVFAELYGSGREVEVGYPDGLRSTIRIEPAPLAPSEPRLAMDSSWVVLLTGGARGITRAVALELGRRFQPTLVLAGRSPRPAPREDANTASLRTPQELKAALLTRLRRADGTVRLADVEEEYQRIVREREMRDTLQALKATGASVRYEQVDVRDEQAVGALLEGIYRDLGRLDGVVHGAGVIEDKLIEQKDPASFERVLGTKADSAFLLARSLRFDELRFLVFFSSASARFGNAGQGDYAAANEVLNKLARTLDTAHPTRVVSINWGPWAAGGMVSPELQRRFAERGVLLIPQDVGVRLFEEELRLGRKGQAEVLVAGGNGLG